MGTWEAVEKAVKKHDAKLEVHGSPEYGILWIDMISVPRRESGAGREIVRLVEKAAKSEGFTQIRLFAADAGYGRSHGFWDLMGYEFTFDVDEDDDDAWYMHKDLR